VYKDSKGEYCIYYEDQWMVRSCKAFYEDRNGNNEVVMQSKINKDCPNRVGRTWYTLDGKKTDIHYSCGTCCQTLFFNGEEFKQTMMYNNRPLYQDSKEEYCMYYGKQWMVRTCEAFSKHGDNLNKFEGVVFLKKATVYCPLRRGDMYWYTPDGKEDRELSFSCVVQECCKTLQYNKEVYYLADMRNNRPVYKDSKEESCIYYGRMVGWMVRTCKAFYKHGDDLYKFDGVELLSKARAYCPNQIGGEMYAAYWYTPDGKQKEVSFSCVGTKSLQDVLHQTFGGY